MSDLLTYDLDADLDLDCLRSKRAVLTRVLTRSMTSEDSDLSQLGHRLAIVSYWT